MELSGRIKEIRVKSGLSQKELAEKLGIAVSTYQYYERGERIPPADFIGNLITSFGVDAAWLVTGNIETGDARIAEVGAFYGLDPITQNIIIALQGMDEESRYLILRLVEDIKLAALVRQTQEKKKEIR
jgi:transcriptional regulator with XRE-family HTH domain